MKPPQAMVASALSFSVMTVCVKQLNGRIPVAEVVLARALISLVLSWWLLRQQQLSPWGTRHTTLIWRGVVGSAALLCVYSAIAQLPLAAATVLQYLYPTFTAALAWGALGERAGKRVLLAMALGWCGVLLVAQPSWLPSFGQALSTQSLPPLAVAIAIAGALLTSLAYVIVRNLAPDEHPLVIVFYFPLISVPLSLPLVLANPVMPTGLEMVWLVGVGVFTQLGQVFLTRGITAMPAAQATAISYVQVLFAALWGWLLFGEQLNQLMLMGALLVLGATLISLRPPRKPQLLR
jgi:drug/metabolite transporter (DMT)-like permease